MWRHRLLTNSFLVQLAITLFLRSAMSAQKQAARNPISQSAVAELLNRKGLQVEPSQVHLPTRIVANSTAPQLRVISADRVGNHQILVGVRCETAGDCLPFNATIDISNEEALSVLKNGFVRNVLGNSTGPQASLHQPGPNISFSPSQRSTEVKMKLGSPITLVIREDRMEIHLPAVAMDSGSPGMRVRVRTLAPEKTFHGVVLDQATVLGEAQ
jgi:hypothetical protein